jgi:hypothetical protein
MTTQPSSVDRIVKCRRLRWAGHVARIRREEMHTYTILVSKLLGKLIWITEKNIVKYHQDEP